MGKMGEMGTNEKKKKAEWQRLTEATWNVYLTVAVV